MVDEGLFVTADPGELSRVVSNLLINAIRHTPADGVVEVTGRQVGDAVELSVTDACGGLSSDDMARVFDVAWQGTPARTPTPGSPVGRGAGLGLAIVKGIVEAHRGQVAVSNHAPGLPVRGHPARLTGPGPERPGRILARPDRRTPDGVRQGGLSSDTFRRSGNVARFEESR